MSHPKHSSRNPDFGRYGLPPRRFNCTTRIWYWRPRKECWLSISTRCTNGSSSINSELRIRGGTLERQRLLIPEPVELPADQAARLLEERAALAELGLEVEAFGGSTLLVTCYPAMLGQQAPAEILRAVADHLAAHDRAPNREQLFNDLLSLMACHAAVKAGDPLTPELIEELLAQRELANDPHHCPHGRPTALLFSRQDLDRQFRRI